MVQRCVAVYGKIDIACNNAGVLGKAVRTHEATIKDYDFVCQVNERGVSLSLSLSRSLEELSWMADRKLIFD